MYIKESLVFRFIMIDCIDAELWQANWWKILLPFSFTLCLISNQNELKSIFFIWWYLFVHSNKSQFINCFNRILFTNHFNSCASIIQNKPNAIIDFFRNKWRWRNFFIIIINVILGGIFIYKKKFINLSKDCTGSEINVILIAS